MLGPRERKQRLIELGNLRRERELREYQKQHWAAMKQAAERNKRQVLGELGRPAEHQHEPQQQPQQQQHEQQDEK